MKQKTHKSALKRFRISGSGKVLRRSAFGRHLRRKKPARQRRLFRGQTEVIGPRARRIKRLISIA